MWRWFSGLPRAVRQHFHGPRASTTGVCQEEVEQCKDVQKSCIFDQDRLGLFACSSRSKGEERSKHGPDQEKWHKQYYKKEFCSFFGNHHTLEALGWGAAVVLGIHLSKCPIRTEKIRRKRSEDGSKHCLLWQVAFALPDPTTTTRKSIASTKKQINADTKQEQKESDDPLYKVMNEFEDICRKYTGLGKNIQGLQEAAKNHMTRAVSSFIDASHLGYTKAQFNLGLCYETGKGVKQDLRKAEKYYKSAADDGHTQAQYNLALLYLKGEGCVEKNIPLALELLQKAAQNGLRQAQTHLGVYYTEEETQDLEKAVSFFKAAADQNDPEAQYFLGVCYEEGWGVEVNACKSAELYAQSASAGHDGALYNLGVFHELGLGGIPVDRVRAIELYQKSADTGNEQAKLQLDKFKAQAAVEEWKYLNPDEKEAEIVHSVITTDEEIQEEKKDEKSIKLNISSSSPSLTDYVRKHLNSFSSTVPYNFMDPISLLRTKPVNSSSQREVTNIELSSLIPQITESVGSYNKPSVQDKVSFTLGADEDDLDGLLRLDSKTDTFPLIRDNPPQIHHFCSFIQRNSTMPDLECVSCN